MKPHYFDSENANQANIVLKMAKGQGYVPQTCLLGRQTVMGIVNEGKDLCQGCNCDRVKCKGRKNIGINEGTTPSHKLNIKE